MDLLGVCNMVIIPRVILGSVCFLPSAVLNSVEDSQNTHSLNALHQVSLALCDYGYTIVQMPSIPKILSTITYSSRYFHFLNIVGN